MSGYAKVFGVVERRGVLGPVQRRFKLRPRSVSVGAHSTRLIKFRLKSNRTSLRQIENLTERAPKKLRKRMRLVLTLVATDAGGKRTKLTRRSALIP